MVFRIAICDDNEAVCNEIEAIIQEYFQIEKIKFDVDVFLNGEELLDSLKVNNRYDLIYLDIELNELNGISIAKYIRDDLSDDFTQIAYISGHSSYAMELFETRPIHFLVKPLEKNKLQNVLMKTLEIQGRQTRVFNYKSGTTEKRVPYKDIMYFSSDMKKTIIHMRNYNDFFYSKLQDVSFPGEEFICIHKSFVVNKNYVAQFKIDCVVLTNGETLPISRPYRNEVRERLKQWQRGDL